MKRRTGYLPLLFTRAKDLEMCTWLERHRKASSGSQRARTMRAHVVKNRRVTMGTRVAHRGQAPVDDASTVRPVVLARAGGRRWRR